MLTAMKHLLLVYASRSGRTEALMRAVRAGAEEFADDVELRVRQAQDADLDDLLWAQGLLLGTPENFGYMAGLVKDFFDRTFYPAEGRTVGLPYALFVGAGNDGSGAARAVERIATGYRWKAVAEPLIVVGDADDAALARARELGQTLAAGLACAAF